MYNQEARRQAKEAERLSQWREAERIYRSIGYTDDAEACASIAEATEKGDLYRERVRIEAGKEPDRIKTPDLWDSWFKKMDAIYKEMFLPNLKK